MNLPKPPPQKPDFSSPEAVFIRTGRAAPNTYRSTKALGMLFRRIGADMIQSRAIVTAGGQQIGADRDANRDDDNDDFGADELLDPSGRITLALKKTYAFPKVQAHLLLEMKAVLHRFADDLHRAGRVWSLTRDPLSEHELLLGTIASAARGGRQKKECLERLTEATSLLYGKLRKEIGGEAQGEERVGRFWAGWSAATEGDEGFGTATFGWVCLGGLMEAVQEVGTK